MAAAQFDAHVRGSQRRLTRLLSAAALAAGGMTGAHAQMAAAPTAGFAATGQASNAPPSNGGGQAPAADQEGTFNTLEFSGRRLNFGGNLMETYTNNPLGVPNASGGQFFTTIGLFLKAHDQTARFNGDLNYTAGMNIYPGHSRLNNFYNNLNALANAVLIRDRLFVNASAFAAPVLLNGTGPLNAAGSNSGLRNTYGYTVTPDLRFRLGDFAISDTTVSQSGIFFDTTGPTVDTTVPGVFTPPASVIQYGGTESIASGRDFSRLNWIVSGSAFKTTSSTLEFEQEVVNATPRYAVSHEVALIGLFGYEWITSNQTLSESFSGAFALGGVQYTPSESFRASASAGRQFNQPSYIGDLNWQITPFTSIVGSAQDGVSTPAGQLIGNLANLGVSGGGDFYNTSFSPTAPPTTASNVTAFNPLPVGSTSLSTRIIRYRTGTLSIVHIDGRTQYRVSGYDATYHTVTPLPEETSPTGSNIGMTFDVSRAFTPRWNGIATLNYSIVKDLGIEYDLIQSNMGVYYTASLNTQVYMYANYTRRNSGDALTAISPVSGSLSTFSISIGISKQFF